MKRIKKFLREIFAPRIVIKQYGNMSQTEMKVFDKKFKQMDKVFSEMQKLFD